jgi:predicted transcriptional regulator of viral defense system
MSSSRAASLTLLDLQAAIPREEFDITFLRHVLRDYSRIEMKIHDLLKSGALIQVRKGLYVFASKYNRRPVCVEALANLVYGPSALSLEWALAFHGLIPERVNRMTSITPNRDKEFETPLGSFSYRRLPILKYAIGIDQVWIDELHPVLIASAEKAICDTLLLQSKPKFKTSADAYEFLTEDMRIDRDKLKTLNLKKFAQIVRLYKKESLQQVQAALEELA